MRLRCRAVEHAGIARVKESLVCALLLPKRRSHRQQACLTGRKQTPDAQNAPAQLIYKSGQGPDSFTGAATAGAPVEAATGAVHEHRVTVFCTAPHPAKYYCC